MARARASLRSTHRVMDQNSKGRGRRNEPCGCRFAKTEGRGDARVCWLTRKFVGGSLSAPMRFISVAATDMAMLSKIGCRPKMRSSHHWSNKRFNPTLNRQVRKALKGSLGDSPKALGQTWEEIATRRIALWYNFQAESKDQTGRAG